MKLLFDQNVSQKLVQKLSKLFPESSHISLLNLQTATDKKIWDYAKEHGFIIVTQDSDFNERSLLFGYPPKIIWIRTGNTSTEHIQQLIEIHQQRIAFFSQDKTLGCLVLTR